MTSVSALKDHHQRKRQHRLLVPELFIASLDGVKTPEQQLIERQEWQRVDVQIDRLPPRCGLALRLYYGLRCEPMTLDQVAERFGVSRERIRQIIAKGVRLLRYRILIKENPRRLQEFKDSDKAKEQAARLRRDQEYEAWRRDRDASQEIERLYARAEQTARAEENLERERLRDAAFVGQARALRDARNAYLNNAGHPDELLFHKEYVRQMHEWGATHDRIWRDFPY